MSQLIDFICQATDDFEKYTKNPVEYISNLDQESKEIFGILHSIYPYTSIFEKNTGDRIMSVIFWIRYCVDLGLISYSESLNLINAIKKSQGLY